MSFDLKLVRCSLVCRSVKKKAVVTLVVPSMYTYQTAYAYAHAWNTQSEVIEVRKYYCRCCRCRN